MMRLLLLFLTILLPQFQVGQRTSTRPLSLSPGWTYYYGAQESGGFSSCSTGTSSCTVPVCTSSNSHECLPNTPAGAVVVLMPSTGNDVTASSGSGGAGTWNLCPSSSCHLWDSANSINQDAVYSTNVASGANSYTVSLSANATGFFTVDVVMLLPPSGYTASLDSAATAIISSCSSCTAAALTVTATDAIVHLIPESGGNVAINGCPATAGWMYAGNEYCVGLNQASGTAPTIVQDSTSHFDDVALAFKSSAGTFIAPSNRTFNVANVSASAATVLSCSPTCSPTVSSTTSGNLLYLAVATDSVSQTLSSATIGGTSFVVPSVCGKTSSSPVLAVSCGYILSAPAASTNLSFTLSGNSAHTAYALVELHRSSGSWAIDGACASVLNSASSQPSGVSFTLAGSDEVVFQDAAMDGGTSGVAVDPSVYSLHGPGGTVFMDTTDTGTNGYYGSIAALLDTASGSAPVWAYPSNLATAVSGCAFK